MRADPANDPRQGEGVHDYFHGFAITALGDESDIAVSVDVIGTGIGAGGAIALLYGVAPWDGLCVGLIGSLALSQTKIKLTRNANRADLGTITAAGTALEVNVTRLSLDGNLKVPHITGYLFNLSKSEQFDIQMPADLDQFGRDNSHGAVVGGKGLV
jgi:hypothetical protein